LDGHDFGLDQIQNSHLGTGQVLHGNSRRPWLCAQRPAKPVHSEIIVTLAVEPQAAVSKDQDELPVATGLPWTWDEIAPGHLVIALVGSHRHRTQRRHIHAAVSGLPEATQVCAPSNRNRVDELSEAVSKGLSD
jgi:hypothetical protein